VGQETSPTAGVGIAGLQDDETIRPKQAVPFDKFIKGKQNVYRRLEERARSQLGPTTRVFVVMPLQGEKYGTQDEQRILKEYDERFDAIEQTLGDLDCCAIRIDKEAPLEGLVDQI
jgi:hypothetical protein